MRKGNGANRSKSRLVNIRHLAVRPLPGAVCTRHIARSRTRPGRVGRPRPLANRRAGILLDWSGTDSLPKAACRGGLPRQCFVRRLIRPCWSHWHIQEAESLGHKRRTIVSIPTRCYRFPLYRNNNGESCARRAYGDEVRQDKSLTSCLERIRTQAGVESCRCPASLTQLYSELHLHHARNLKTRGTFLVRPTGGRTGGGDP